MTREWVDDRKKKPVDKRWVMRCDNNRFSDDPRCPTESEPSWSQPDLWQFAAQGWHIDDRFPNDICPVCLDAGVVPKRAATHYPTPAEWF